MLKIIIAFCLVGMALAQYGHDDHKVVDYYAAPVYKFKYGVHDPHTHDIKEHVEERKDDHVRGHYSLKQKDGNIRSLHYEIVKRH